MSQFYFLKYLITTLVYWVFYMPLNFILWGLNHRLLHTIKGYGHEWSEKSMHLINYKGLLVSKASLVAQMLSICLQSRRPGFNPWVGKIPWRRKWQPVGTSPTTNQLEGVVPQENKEKLGSEIKWGSRGWCHSQAKAQILILACFSLLTSTLL